MPLQLEGMCSIAAGILELEISIKNKENTPCANIKHYQIRNSAHPWLKTTQETHRTFESFLQKQETFDTPWSTGKCWALTFILAQRTSPGLADTSRTHQPPHAPQRCQTLKTIAPLTLSSATLININKKVKQTDYNKKRE